MNFIIDTGACVSIIPSSFATGLYIVPSPITLSSASGQPIETQGQATVEMAIPSLRRSFTWNFIVAETTKPIIGIDFLHEFGLSVDCKSKQLIDSITNKRVSVDLSSTTVNIVVNNVDIAPNIKALLHNHPYLTSPQENKQATYCGVYHRIDTGSHAPVFAKPRQMNQVKYDCAKKSFDKMMNDGIIRRSESEWSSPLHLVPKTNGEFRPCGDYRALNSITKPDRYPLPNMNSFSSRLADKTCFSKIDLVSAYHQIKMNPDDIAKTAVTVSFGLFEFQYMPFGLKNAAATFQRMMDKIFAKLSCVFVYIDDILVFSDDEQSHMQDLESVFQILTDNNLKISLPKCLFNVKQLDFLGYNISSEGLKPTSQKLTILSEFPYPKDSHSLRRFLGMIGFYRKLIPNYAKIVYPLSECMRNNPNLKSLNLTEVEKQSFDNIKCVLSKVTALSHPRSDVTHYQLVTDSSSYAVGAALHQMVNSEPIPIGFFSKKLSQAQSKYSTFDRELLAAYLSIIHFKHQIEGRNVVLLTDHKPLCTAFTSINPSKSDRQQRHLSLLTEYLSDVSFIKGSQNVVADCLSRPANAIFIDACDLSEIAREQSNDIEIKGYSERLKPYKITHDDLTVLCDISTPYPRPYVPISVRKSIFHNLHDISHPGIRGTSKLIKARYFWPFMDKTIKQWCSECVFCQESKINKHVHSSVQNFDLPSDRFQTIHIDIVGPLPSVRNRNNMYSSPYKYLLTMIDRATRWLEVYPLSDITAKNVALAFVEGWVARFGVPLHVITDRGTQFESELFSELSNIVGFSRLRTTAYHPQCNGLIERAHRTFKTAIISKKQSWLISLPVILLGLRSIPNESGYSPFTAVTGTSILLPQIMIDLDPQCNINSEHDSMNKLISDMSNIDLTLLSSGKSHSIPKSYVPKELENCDKVWLRVDRVRKSLEAPYSGPYKVLSRTSKHFKLEFPNNIFKNVSIDRLKPFISPFKGSSAVETDVEKIEENSGNENPSIKLSKNSPKIPPKIESPRPRFSRAGRRISWKKNDVYHYY